jgi:hypothetical protein
MPEYKRVCPEVIIREEDGKLVAERYPDTPEVTLKKEWYGQPFKLHDDISNHDNWRKYWMTKDSWRNMVQRCKQVTGLDLNELLDKSPKRAVEAINKTARQYNTEGDGPSRERSCGVCDRRLDPLHDTDFEEIDNTVVCERHSVQDLKAAGLI